MRKTTRKLILPQKRENLKYENNLKNENNPKNRMTPNIRQPKKWRRRQKGRTENNGISQKKQRWQMVRYLFSVKAMVYVTSWFFCLIMYDV